MTEYSTDISINLEGEDKEHLEIIRDSVSGIVEQFLEDAGAGDLFIAYVSSSNVETYEEEDYDRDR